VNSPKTLARIAGLLYLLVAVFDIFAALYVRSRLVRSGDATGTADNLRSSGPLFRIGFVSDVLGATFFLLLAMALYVLLRHVNQLAAGAMVTFVAVAVAISFTSLTNWYTAFTVAADERYTRTFGKTGADALTALFADMQKAGSFVDTMFFGLWLFPLAYLVIRSGYFPRVLGALLALAGFGWITDFFTYFLAPDAIRPVSVGADILSGIGELSFMVWLLVVGVRVPVRQTDPPALVRS
jgi:hypothetical protein